MFHYTVETNNTVHEAISALEAALQEQGFGVLWSFDLGQKLIDKGLSFDGKYVILEVCNPAEAKKVMDENPLAGYFLPCKIAVYEHEGTTRIGLPRPTSLIGMVENESITSLTSIAHDVEQRLIGCIDKAKQS